jgi:acyl carrier protein
MELDQFIENFAAQFDETDASEFEANTDFKSIDEWSSLTALSIIAMVDDEYSVRITGADIKNAATISAIYELVKSKS